MFRFLLFLFVVAVDAKLSAAADPANLLFSQSDSQEDVVCPVDVAFIMDASGSQETVFRNEKEIVIGITKSMSIGVTKEKSRASLMHFSVLAEVDGLFGTYATATEFQRAVRGLLFLGRQTRIDRALAKASRKVFKKSSSSRPQIAVILTNGIQRSESQEIPKGLMEASQPLRNKGVRVIAVGITTDSSEKRLRLMTERDSDVVVDTNKSFVMNKVKLLFEDACIRYCLDQKMDIAILADTSRSMSEDQLKKLTELVETMIDQTDVSPEGSHYGFITFDREVKVHTTISNTEYYNKDDLKSLIGKIQELRKVDWGTRSDIALSEAKNKLFTADGGDRPDAKNFLFLFTDGKFFITGKDKKPFIPIENSTKALEKEKVKITIIAILGKSCRKSDAALQACNDSMKKMAGELGEVLMFEDFNDLVKRYQEVLDSLCHPLPAHSPGASVACKDKLRQCAFYAAKPNYCKNHPDYMGEHCPRSCNLCPAIY